MRRKFITFTLALLIPAFVGIINIYQWLRPDKPNVTLLWEFQDGFYNVPKSTRNVLYFFSRIKGLMPVNTPVPEAMWQDFQNKLSNQKPLFNDRTNAELISEAFGPLFSQADTMAAPVYTPSVVHVRILNLGSAAANDTVILVGQPGYFEIWPFGSPQEPEQQGRTTGEIKLGSLNPKQQKRMYFWPETPLGESLFLDASYAGGSATLAPANVPRNGDNIVFSFTRFQIVVSIAVVVVLVIAFILIISAKRTRPSA